MSTQPWTPDPIRTTAHERYDAAFSDLVAFIGGGLTTADLRPFVDEVDDAWAALTRVERSDLWSRRRHRWLRGFVDGLDEGLGRSCDCETR